MSLHTNPPVEEAKRVRQAGFVIGGSMAFAALRCTIQYIVLPFILPLFGIGNLFSTGLNITLELIALSAIAYNIYRLWDTEWRWRYLSFSTLVVFIIAVFLYADLQMLWNLS